MSPATVRGERPWTIALVVFFPLFWGASIGAGCVETRRSLGEDCLKDDDCLSGVCSQLRCAAIPPTIDASVLADVTAANPVADAPAEAPDDAQAPEAAQAPDADAGAEASEDTGDEPTSSSAGEASIDGDNRGD